MRKFGLRHVLRLAVIVLLALNAVPEALAAVPVCSGDFGPARPVEIVNAAMWHAQEANSAHECVATMPGKVAAALHAQIVLDDGPAVLPVVPHPATMLAARGPSPRGSPARTTAYLTQRSSVLLLI
jgi:hypothetical protein